MTNSSSKPRYLFIIDNLLTGGAQRQIVTLAVGLKQRGYHVEVFCYTPGDSLANPLINVGVPIHRFEKRSRYSSDVVSALNKLLSKNKYDLILSYLTTPNFYAILSGRILLHDRIPVVVSERRVDLPGGARIRELWIRHFYRLASWIVTNSHHQRQILANQYPWLQTKLSTIYNGLDLSFFSPAESEPDSRPIKILAVASFVSHKNGLCLIEALQVIKEKYEQYPQVDWIGRQIITENQKGYLYQAKQLINQFGLDEQWHWLNLRSDIPYQLQKHDVFIHPSYVEGLPNVVCEALACARPVIVSNTMDHSRLVQHGKNGYLFDHKNPEDLADKVKLFTDLPIIERRKMAECSRMFAEANLSQERLVNDYEELFLSLLIR